MPEMRTLSIQSILFGNTRHDIERAIEAVSTSAAHALEAGLVTRWEYFAGD